jgi:hypothetical protein
MRYKEFKILLEAADAPVYVVGDSIAVGVKNAGGAPGIAVGGKSAKEVLGMVNDLIQSNNLKGAKVIISTGASNSTYERPNGEAKPLEMADIDAQLKALKAAGANVFVVGTGSKASPWITNRYGQYRINFAKEDVNDKLAAAASANGATFLGPLEEFDPNLNSGKGDGIHPYGGYQGIFNAVTKGKTPAPTKGTKGSATDKAGQGGKPEAKVPLTSLTIPTMDKGPEVADIQKVLKAAGYGELLGPFGDGGVDGVIGKYTMNTIRTFQKDSGIKPITGMPDAKTVAKLTELLNSKFKGKIAKSDSSDVKLAHASAVKRGSAAGQASMGTGSFANEKHIPNIVPAADIKAYLLSKGLDRNQVAGILANIKHESSFDSGILGDGGTSAGLFQHHNTRFSNMMAATGGSNKWQTNWKGQIDFALSEPEASAYKTTKFASPQEAATAWVTDFEKPKYLGKEIAARSATAPQYA